MNPEEPFHSIALVGAVVLFPVVLFFRIRSQMTRELLDRRQEGWFILFTLRPIGISFMVAFIAYLVDPQNLAWSAMPLVPGWLRWAGVGLALAGAALFLWTLTDLGKNLTDTVVTRKAATLVTSGPYRFVRHPFYVAALFAAVANALVAANWFLLVTGLLTFALMVVRLSTEEAKLIERFGNDYRAYMARTNRFWPRF